VHFFRKQFSDYISFNSKLLLLLHIFFPVKFYFLGVFLNQNLLNFSQNVTLDFYDADCELNSHLLTLCILSARSGYIHKYQYQQFPQLYNKKTSRWFSICLILFIFCCFLFTKNLKSFYKMKNMDR